MRTGMEWDEWFHLMCTDVAKKSQCLSRKIGAILVRDNSIFSDGYNGPPRGVRTCDERWLCDPTIIKEYNKRATEKGRSDKVITNLLGKDEERYKKEFEGKCPRYIPEMGFKSGQGLEWCVAGHAERNALINAARLGISTKDSIIYMDCGIPCTPCLVEIINAGIKEIVVTKLEVYDVSAIYLLKESHIEIRMYKHLCKHENRKAELGLWYNSLSHNCPDCGYL
jgi:dCMP deaminase